MRYFATAIPGIAPILTEELRGCPDIEVVGRPTFDGRNDIVAFDARGDAEIKSLRTAEDIFVEVGRSKRRRGLDALMQGLLEEAALARGLSVFAAQTRPLRSRMTARVIARVLSEHQFHRTELRDQLMKRILTLRPRWKHGDPADIELWVVEAPNDRFRLGVRLTSTKMRHRGGREVERIGALRPTVAAAMVRLTGTPRGRLYDPFCGSGSILSEAATVGWQAAGSDIDPTAVQVARENLGLQAEVRHANATDLPLADKSVDAVVSNLPFGKEYELPRDPHQWFKQVLGEIVRITVEDASVVLLMPRSQVFHRALAAESQLEQVRRIDIRLLGLSTAVWQLTRKSSS